MRILIVGSRAAGEVVASHEMSVEMVSAANGQGRAAAQPFIVQHATEDSEALDAVDASGGDLVAAFLMPGSWDSNLPRRLRARAPELPLVVVTSGDEAVPARVLRDSGRPEQLILHPDSSDVEGLTRLAWTLCERRRLTAELEATRAALATHERMAGDFAAHDPLTGAPNRSAFLRLLNDCLRGQEAFAVALLDMDRFKAVNDSFGHLVGDALIREVCATLEGLLESDGLVARLGGDEFGLIFPALGEQDAVMRCERLALACASSRTVRDVTLHPSASVGMVLVEPGSGADAADVMRRADLALGEAKRSGPGTVRQFDYRMDETIRFRREIEQGLNVAADRGELTLVFQPICSRNELEVTGFEALLRWCSPAFGIIAPAMFIPIAEESDLIHRLGDWVLGEALEAVKRWPDQYVSVNFSPRQFRRHNFIGHIVEQVQRAGVSPERLQIEITETALFDNAEFAADILYRLRQMGFRVALDDFGMGYSSLYNIRKFPLDCVKIDRSFIDAMGREPQSAAIVHAIVQLGRTLGFEVVASGVENDAQVQALRLAGCSHLQGYHLSRPLVGDDAAVLAHGGSVLFPTPPCEDVPIASGALA